MKNIVIDIETFSSEPNAALASIGAIAWTDERDAYYFYKVIRNDTGGHFSPQTIRWHMALDVGLASVGTEEEAEDFEVVMKEFASFLREHDAHKRGECAIWTHATFDMPVLRQAYLRTGKRRPPWAYGNCRDLRTLYQLAGGRPTMEETGYTGNHNAMEDCEAQRKEVEICLARLS